jgi:hypothetical protein
LKYKALANKSIHYLPAAQTSADKRLSRKLPAFLLGLRGRVKSTLTTGGLVPNIH